jgi:hypothetical protein
MSFSTERECEKVEDMGLKSSLNQLGFGKTRADNVRFSFGVVWKH